VAGGDTFDGPVPDPVDAARQTQPRKLVAVTAARVLDAGPPVATPGQGQAPSKSTVLDESSLVDLTGRVNNGRISWQAPGTGNWILFAFWSRENSGNYTNPFDADATRKATEDLDEIEVKVRTTLRNAVTTYNHSTTVTQPYGLRGPIRLDPYDSVVVYDGRG
jgi:hypothetical protein